MALAVSSKPDVLVTTYLEMTELSEFSPSFIEASDIEIVEMERPDLAFYKFLYSSVGEDWAWRDRLIMPNAELRAILSQDSTKVFVLYVSGSPGGYVELYREDDGSVEIAYFGLRNDYMGRGLGKHLLSYGIKQAWAIGATRVWLHTCNLDAPHALTNYQKRGFKVYKTEEEPMPDRYI